MFAQLLSLSVSMVSDNTANGLNLRCLPIHLWTHAHDATEEAGEIVRVVNAELVAYLIYLHLCVVNIEQASFILMRLT